jgi:hypothetical protein
MSCAKWGEGPRGAAPTHGVAIHLLHADTGVYNQPFLGEGLVLVKGWRRMQGVVFRPGDSRFEGRSVEAAIQTATDDPTRLMVNRNQGPALASCPMVCSPDAGRKVIGTSRGRTTPSRLRSRRRDSMSGAGPNVANRLSPQRFRGIGSDSGLESA